MRASLVVALYLLAPACGTTANAMPRCDGGDVAELCKIATDTRADNPEFGKTSEWTAAAGAAREERHAKRRTRAKAILSEVADPTWHDLFNAGYTIAYGTSPEERLLSLAIGIRALTLAPNEPDVRLLVAMTTDAIGRNYVGAQLYGRQKFFKLNPATGGVESWCLPQMIEPALPASVGLSFDAPAKGSERCPPGVGETPLAPPIAQNK